jgi:hypothetical protein
MFQCVSLILSFILLFVDCLQAAAVLLWAMPRGESLLYKVHHRYRR